MGATTRTAGALVAAGAALAFMWPTTAAADQNYRTQKYPLTPVGGAPDARGFVINTHANGPVIYGQERYHLAEAPPSTTYQVTLEIFGDDDCTVQTGLAFPTATLTTNAAGVGQAKATFYAQEVAPLIPEPTTVYGAWTLSIAGEVAYTTGCRAIALDVPPPSPPRRAGH